MNTTGNFAIGGTLPLATHSDEVSLRVGGLGMINGVKAATAGKSMRMSNNVQLDTDDSYEYIITDEASLYSQYSGAHRFYVADSGTAGTDITFDQPAYIDGTGLRINPIEKYENVTDTSTKTFTNTLHNSPMQLLITMASSGQHFLTFHPWGGAGVSYWYYFMHPELTDSAGANPASAGVSFVNGVDCHVRLKGTNQVTLRIQISSGGGVLQVYRTAHNAGSTATYNLYLYRLPVY